MAEFFSPEKERKAKNYDEIFNPLDYYSDEELYRRYRFNREMIENLVQILGDDLEKDVRGRGVGKEV